MFRLFLLFCVLYGGHPVGVMWAQGSIFEKITIEQGLSQGMIFDILQTRDGFLWVATKDGLNRYDGYNFKVFANNPFNPFSLAQNNATVLFEDSRGLLWIGLDSKGLDVFDPKTGRFHHFPLDYKRPIFMHGLDVRRIVELPDSSICVLRVGIGLIRIDVPDDWKNGLPDEALLEKLTKPKVFHLEMDLNAKPLPEAVLDLNLLQNGDLLATTNLRQFRVNSKTGSFAVVHPGMVTTNARWSVQGDETFGGDLWVGQGSEIRRLRGGQIKSFVPDGPFCNLMLTKGQKGHIWLSLCGKLWDLEPGEELDFSKPDFTVDCTITCLELDKNRNLWLGTSGYGLRKINAVGKRFHTGARGVSVRGLWRNPAGRYFAKNLATIQAYDPSTGQLAAGSAFSKNKLDDICLNFEPDGTTWLLCWEKDKSTPPMLRRFAPDGRLLKSYPFEAESMSDLLLRLRDGSLLLTPGRSLLTRFDPRTEQFEQFNFAQLFGEKSGSVRVTALAEGEGGLIWVGTQLGLVKCTPNAQGFDYQLFEADPTKPQGLNNSNIASILPTPDGQIWLGTKGGGINIFDPKTNSCHRITTADGLLNDVVYGILPGSHPSEFWCSTNRGLAKIMVLKNEPFQFEITTFTAAVGLQDNEFNTNAHFKAANGELLFGGVNGLNHFFPEQLSPDTTPPPVLLIGLEVNRKKADFGSPGSPLLVPLEMTRHLELNYDHNNISFEFAALDLTDPAKNRYRYRLVGLENDWVEAGPGRFAHYSHLPPGRYTLQVQGSNGESRWRAAAPLTLIVRPPWYRSDLAYLIYFLLFSSVAWRAYQFQIRRIKEREQLAFEHREMERVKALEQLKTNFFSNVTHEFRTPLTLIIEPLRQLTQNPDAPDRGEKIRLAEKNSRQLLALVNQLLDMAKLESGQMALDLRRGDLGLTVRESFERFLPLAEKRRIKLVLLPFPQDLPVFDFDKGKVELILNNLISNALKFTPEGGRVEVACRNISDINGSKPYHGVEISVRDTGIGIAPEHLDKIFDRFYQVDGSHTRSGEGTGIGLALSKELAELMGGRIAVDSEVGKGATFRFTIYDLGFTIYDLGFTIYDLGFTIGAVGLAPRVEEGPTFDPSKVTKIPKPDPSRVTKNPKSIALVMEDNVELREFIKQSISANWQVIEASNGMEGIEKAQQLLPDLVISDVMMPLKDGFAVVDELKNNELTAHIPIILLTAKSGIESRLKALRRGADDYLTKPFSTEELLVRMENLAETRRKLRELFGPRAMELANLPESSPSVTNADELLSEPDRDFLRRFALLVEEKLDDEQIAVEDFAARMLLSRSQLHRKLEALTGQSAWEFVRNYRLDRAHAMLKNREGRVSEIALRVGFGSEKHFSTVFKERFGVSPSQVRP